MSTNSTTSMTPGPPPDVLSRPQESRQPALYACVITTYTVSAIFVVLRFYTRSILLRRPLISADWCILAAWLSTGGLVASSLEQLHHGMGRHIWDTDPASFSSGVRAAWYGYVFYSTAMCLTKVSILLLYLTFLGVGVRARRAALATLAFVVVANLWIAASNFTACVPLQAYWDYGLRARLLEEGKEVYCHPNMVYYVNSSINVVTDFVIFALPLPVVLSMRKLALRQKMALLGLFGMGFFVCLVAIIRLVFLISPFRNQDYTWNISINTFWTSIEINISIAVANAMTLRPLLTRWFPRAFVSFDAAVADKHDSARENANHHSLDAANFVNDVAVAPPTIGSRRTRTAHRDDHARAESWIDFPGKLDGRGLNEVEQGGMKLKDVSTTTTAITLDALRVDTHHYGKCLIVRTVALPHTGVGTTTIVEDETGAVERLVIFAYSDSSILSNVPEGCFVAIKEPFFRSPWQDEEGGQLNQPPGAFISIDHPSDIVLLRFNDPAIAARFGSVTPLLGSANEWKQAGDASFLQGDLATAAFCYTEALDFASTNNNTTTTTTIDRQGILAKRAGTHLLLGRFDAARADALESLTEGDGGSSDWRAHQTAAKASYALGEFPKALAHLESALRLNPTSAALIKDRDRARARVAEEETGEYDFAALAATLSLGRGGRCTLDVANFTRRTEERPSATHGRGLFATERIPAGELVFVEKATVMPPQYDEERSSAALYAGVVRRMLDSPTLARRLCGMFSGDYAHATGHEGEVVDGVAVVDVFHAELVRVKNCFSAPLTTAANLRPDVARQPPQARGMWPLAAAMNHACVASTTRAFVGDVFITRALRDIEEGEELTQQYIPVRADVGARQGQYGQWWGFECGCVLCAAEKGLEAGEGGGDMVRRRRLLLKQIEKMVDRSATTVEMSGAVDVFGKAKADNGTVRNVERVMGLLEGAHEVGVYGPNMVFADADGVVGNGDKGTSPLLLPRLLLIFPNLWLLDAYRGRRMHAKVVQMATKLLRNFGFVSFPGPEGTTMRDFFERQPQRSTGIMTIHLVRALMCSAEALGHLGRADEAGHWEAAARFASKVVTGWENDPAVMLGSS
ncbi:hypothetical protein PspLS_11288 [Pyricularia sp. CBS 133598]|nr:hypothetical protein PspLS_11288 [Pyricularia sp. CBS 133598]